MTTSLSVAGGRDHRFQGNIVRSLPGEPLSPHIVTITTYNPGCYSPSDPNPETSQRPAALPYAFLERVPYNTSNIWIAMFPELANLLEHSPCAAAGNVSTAFVVAFPQAC